VDFKFIDDNGVVVATADTAGEARSMLHAAHALFAGHILLDDTGIEISRAELEILYAAELTGLKPRA